MIGREFFLRDTLTVARELVGVRVHVVGAEGELCGGIVETEAYLGADDPASHAAGGPTGRSAIMFGPPGVAYVYLIYGVHHCLNFVTEEDGTAGAVLIRALEPLSGQQHMAANRGLDPVRFSDRDLCSGPGKLCQALDINRSWNGTRLNGKGPHKIWLTPSPQTSLITVSSPRIGIRQATNRPYRFTPPQSPYLSR